MNCVRPVFSKLCGGSCGKDGADAAELRHVATTPTLVGTSGSGEEEDTTNAFKKYGLDSPPQGEGKPHTLSEVKRLIKKDGFGKYLKNRYFFSKEKDEDTRNKAKCLVYLYGRGFYLDSSKEKRKEKINDILNKPSALKRLLLVLEADGGYGGGDHDITASHEEFYNRNCAALRRYFRQDGSFGFLPPTAYFRIQRGRGNCFMHAPCTLMAYLLQHHLGGDIDASPVDLTKFVLHSFSDEELHKYVVIDNGGETTTFLRRLLRNLFSSKDGDNILCLRTYFPKDYAKKGFKLKKKLNKHGPGLVSEFKVNKHFKNEERYENSEKIGFIRFIGRHHKHGQFVELPDELEDEELKASVEMTLLQYLKQNTSDDHVATIPKDLFQSKGETNASVNDSSEAVGLDGGKNIENEESHAMILLGGRIENGRLYMLLQNWWEDMPLVEVDTEYLKNSHATLTFVRNDKEEFESANLENFYTMNHSLVADSNNLDRADYAFSDGYFGLPCFESQQRDR